MLRPLVFAVIAVSCLAALSDIRPPVFPLTLRRGRTLLTQTAVPGKTHNSDSVCEWDEAAKECGVSLTGAAGYLADADSPYAQFVAGFAECEAATGDEEKCNAVGKCIWDPHTSRCILIEFDVGYEESVCVVDAPATIHSTVASEKCRAYMTQLSCYKDPDCDWDQDGLMCHDNGFAFYFGVSITDIFKAAEGVVHYKSAILQEQFPLYFNLSDPEFDWSDVLEWDAPETDCPEWSDPLICDFVDGIFQNIAAGFYCSGKYYSIAHFKDCIRDPICEFEIATASCKAPDVAFAAGARDGLRALIAGSAKPVDKELMMKVLDCNEAATKETCEEGCLWTESGGLPCRIRGDTTAWMIASPGKNATDDPICTYATVLAESGCLDHVDIGGVPACLADPNCVMQIDGDCTASVDYLVNIAIEMDPELKASYSVLQTQCLRYRNKKECNSAPSETIV